MKYRRMPMEFESPEEFGLDKINYNLAESSVPDVHYSDLRVDLSSLVFSYGDHRGKSELREVIADDAQTLKPENVLVTQGAAQALYCIYTALLKPNDHIVVAHPNYILNVECPRAVGANVELIHQEFENGWNLNVDKLASMVTPDTNIVSITVPHNPTGTMMSADDLTRIIEITRKNGCYLIVDEVYREMTFGPKLPVAASLSENVISVSSMSKSYGLPGIRIGWLITQDVQLYESLLAAKELTTICNSITDEEIAHTVMRNKETFLEQFKDKINRKLAVVTEWMDAEENLEWIKPEGGVVCFPRIKPGIALDIDKFYSVLKEKYNTFVGPGHWFEVDRRFMRIGYGWIPLEDLQSGLQCVSKALRESMF